MDDIVKLLWCRDERALELLVSHYEPLCRQIILGLLGDTQEIEEALSDVWFQVWNRVPPAKPKYLRAYLAKTARNTALHYLERQQAQKRRGVTVLFDELAECIPDSFLERPTEGSELGDILNQFVHSLHGEERSIFLGRYYFGESIPELVASHECPENHIAVKLLRTRKKLRAILEKEGYKL